MADLKQTTIPTLLLQGDDDQIVLIDIASRHSVMHRPNANLAEETGAPRGLRVTHANRVKADLLAFVKL